MGNSYRQDETVREISKLKTVTRLLSYLLRYRLKIICVVLLILFGTGVSLANPVFMEVAIDKFIRTRNFDGLVPFICIAGILNVLMIVALRVRMGIMARLTNRVISEIREAVFVHVHRLDLSYFDSRPSGKILSRITGDVNALKDVIENSVTNLIPNIVTVICVVAIMLYRSPLLAAFSLIGLPILVFGLVFIARNSHRWWQVKSKKNSNLIAFVNECLSGIKVVQSFCAEKETQDTMETLVEEDRNAFLKAVRWADGNFSIIDFSWGVCIFFLYFAGVFVVGPDNLSIGTLVAFATYLGMFWQPIMNLSQFYNQLVTSISKAERIFEVIDTKSSIVDCDNPKVLDDMKGKVEFDKVVFGYEGWNPVTGDKVKAKKNILYKTVFSVEPGETIALVGPTGAGKSTIVNLLSRFYDIQEGRILVDGIDIREIKLESLRGQMGIMNQDSFIFSGTIRENILYGKPDAGFDEVVDAAKSVHAHDFIMNLKDGYDTVLTSRGTELSNGQKQLIALARTMISRPRILILDEATSSIDTKTERLVQLGIEEILKGRTSFVIAHRLSTIQNADRIFVVDKGGIVESGTPSDLMAKKGAYYDLIQAAAS